MALNSLLCADVPLRTYTLTQVKFQDRSGPNSLWCDIFRPQDRCYLLEAHASVSPCDVMNSDRRHAAAATAAADVRRAGWSWRKLHIACHIVMRWIPRRWRSACQRCHETSLSLCHTGHWQPRPARCHARTSLMLLVTCRSCLKNLSWHPDADAIVNTHA